jgi:hypothetical protein
VSLPNIQPWKPYTVTKQTGARRNMIKLKAKREAKLRCLRPESASELYRPSDRYLSAKIVPTFTDRGWHVVSVTDPLRP